MFYLAAKTDRKASMVDTVLGQQSARKDISLLAARTVTCLPQLIGTPLTLPSYQVDSKQKAISELSALLLLHLEEWNPRKIRAIFSHADTSAEQKHSITTP